MLLACLQSDLHGTNYWVVGYSDPQPLRSLEQDGSPAPATTPAHPPATAASDYTSTSTGRRRQVELYLLWFFVAP